MSDTFSVRILTTTLAGVKVEVSPSLDVLPKVPDPAQMGVIWATSRLGLRRQILMSNGERWVVSTVPRYNGAGDVTVTLVRPGGLKPYVMITVPKASLDTPIWWVGVVPPPIKAVPIAGTGTTTTKRPA